MSSEGAWELQVRIIIALKCGGLTHFAFSQKFLKVARYVGSFCRQTRHTSQICVVGKLPIPS